jgi:hypothetical protein
MLVVSSRDSMRGVDITSLGEHVVVALDEVPQAREYSTCYGTFY